VSEGRIAFSSLDNIEEFQSRLREIPGIGDWTLQYIAMRALGDPDALPASDLGLLHNASFSHERELTKRAEAWRPWRAYAAMHFWQGTNETVREDNSSKDLTPTLVRTALSPVERVSPVASGSLEKVARASRP
jgi:3-methyladenine DNA glycosylase/8-oxoguanine DNA glycosylase